MDVILGTKAYAIGPLPLRRASAMRRRVEAEIKDAAGLIAGLQSLNVSSVNPGDLAGLLQAAAGLVVGLPEKLFDLLCEYSPEIAADREALLDTAFDDQVLAAFVEALKLLIPLAQLQTRLNGLGGPETWPSSPSPNTGSKNSTN